MVNNRWARLSQNEKAELLGIYTSMGYNDLASIIAHYNSCGGKLKADGGPVINTAQYKSDAYLYNPPVNVGAPIEVPLRYKPLPYYGDYVPQRTSGILEDIPIELGLEVPQRGYGVLIPDAPSAMPTLDARQDAARRIMAVENSKNNVNGGYDAKTGRWYPHKSHEGGADTIAYGIKLSNGTPEAALALKQGYLTDEQAESAVDTLVQKYYNDAKKVYDKRFGEGEWDKLSDKSQSILVDYSYNPGLSKFTKLMDAFHSGDKDGILKEYKRYSGKQELGRNKTLFEEIQTLGNEYPIFRAEGGRLYGDGGENKYPTSSTRSYLRGLSDYVLRRKTPHSFVKSEYRPTVGDEGETYYTRPGLKNEVALNLFGGTDFGKGVLGSNYFYKDFDDAYNSISGHPMNRDMRATSNGTLGQYSVTSGADDRGRYLSFTDKFDHVFIPGEPIHIYDRIYEDEVPLLYDAGDSAIGLGDALSRSPLLKDMKASGGKIHIKPENRGKFTALKKRTGHSASWFKAHGTPAQKKMAVFALNARKWKHEDGGLLDNYFYDGGPYGVIPLGGDYLTYLQTIPEVSGGSIDPAIVTAPLPAKFNGSQAAAARYAEGYQKGAKPVSEAMNRAGQDIFKAVDTVVGLTPTPAGAISWLGHMGVDAAEGEWGKVGRDVVLAAALGAGARGVSWLKNYVDDATNFGEDIFRAFTDSAPERVSTNFTYLAPAARASMETVPVVERAVSAPYEIENLGGGYMLKSLMRGNKLESKLSKDGLIKTDVIRGYANQSGGVQKAVMDKILASNEFAGKKSIDYNKFRRAVQDELITYERTPDTRYNDYGVSSLGLRQSEDLSHLRNIEDFAKSDRFEVVSTDTIGQARLWLDKTTGDILNWDGVTQRYLGEHDVLNAGPGLNTFTFSSSRIPQGSDRHYDPNTLGHSRTYTTSGEPDVLHVMESQSDWAQQGVALDRSKKIAKAEERYPGGFEARRDKAIGDAKKDVETWKRIIETGVAGDGRKLEAWEIENIRTDWLYNAERRLRELEATYSYVDPQELYLSDNFAPRQIQENLRYAAEKGQKKMRYPTRDTAAKIEGYSEGTMYFDANGNDVTKTGQSVTALPEEWQKKYDDIENKIRALTEKDEEYGSIAFKRHENDKTTWITQKTYGDVIDLSTQQREILENHSELRPGITRKKIWTANGDQKTAEMILQKYDAFPKQFKKLYKNADVRTVTDPKGNTWYEVDVPENYLRQEWAYKNGGLLREFTNISDIF